MLKKYAVRFIINGASRTYIVADLGTPDAICQALDHIECDVPGVMDARGLAIIAKPYPEGAHLAVEGEGPIINKALYAIIPEPALEAA